MCNKENNGQIRSDGILKLEDPGFTKENVCIVTGAGSGIGQAIAVAAAVNGLTTLGLGRDAQNGQKTVEMANKLGADMKFLQADLTEDKDIHRVVETAAAMGNIRYLANIAGLQHVSSIEDFPMEKFDYMQKLMLRAPFYLSKLVIPYMKNNPDGVGVIGNIGSVHSHICTLNKSAYAMAKFGIRALSQSISAEGEGKVRSFSVTTPYVETPLVLKQIPHQAKTRNITEQQVVQDVMLGRSRVKEMMTTTEAANIFMFCFSQHARFLVGGDMMFDAGMILTY